MNGSGVTYCLGTPPRIGTIAADLTLFKPGTILEIPGYGYGTVEDIGKAIKGRRIDIFMGEGDHACEKALEWGMKTIQVKVIYSG